MTGGMRVGALVLQTQPWARARRTWRDVEASGVDVAYVADHLTHPTVAGRWWADGWSLLAAAASPGFDELVVYWPNEELADRRRPAGAGRRARSAPIMMSDSG